jgi:quinol monooxygenase YgiN
MDNAKFALVATFDITPGHRDQLIGSLLAHKTRSLRDEPGTLQFEVLLPSEDESKVLTYEAYRDDVAFETHRNGASIAQWREEAKGMFSKFTVTRCAPAA